MLLMQLHDSICPLLPGDYIWWYEAGRGVPTREVRGPQDGGCVPECGVSM